MKKLTLQSLRCCCAIAITALLNLNYNAAKAIPKDEALNKLNILIGFTITDFKEDFYAFPNQENSILIFNSASDAIELLRSIQGDDIVMQNLKVTPYNLGRALEKVIKLNAAADSKEQAIDYRISFVARKHDKTAAKKILEKTSTKPVSLNEISFPVFYTQPMMQAKSTNNSTGKTVNVGLFFSSHKQILEFINNLPESKRKMFATIKVSDITNVLKFIETEPEDKYMFYPGPNFLELREKAGVNDDGLILK